MFASRILQIALTYALGVLPAQAVGQERPAASAGEQTTSLVNSNFRQDAVKVGEATISYVVRKGTGPTLVLVPGSFDSADSWLEVIAKLDPELQIVIVELRGHGQSWPPPTSETGTIEQFARDVFAAAKHAGLRSFYVGGHSIGGMVAIECARQKPDLIRGVVSIEGWTRSAVLGAAFQGRTDSTLSDAEKQRKLELRRPTTSRWTKEQISAFAQIWQHWDGTQILEQTAAPVLELWGDRGVARPAPSVLGLPQRSNIHLVWVAGASHFLPLERPTEVAEAVNRFITQCEDARSR